MTDPWKSLEAKLSESGYADERKTQPQAEVRGLGPSGVADRWDESMRERWSCITDALDRLRDEAAREAFSPPAPWYARLWRRLRR